MTPSERIYRKIRQNIMEAGNSSKHATEYNRRNVHLERKKAREQEARKKGNP